MKTFSRTWRNYILSYYALSISSSYFCHHYNLALLLRSNLRSRMYIFCIKCKMKGKLVYLAEIYWSFTVLAIDRRYRMKLLINLEFTPDFLVAFCNCSFNGVRLLILESCFTCMIPWTSFLNQWFLFNGLFFFFFFCFLVQRLPAIEIDSVESTISKAYRSTCRMRHRRPVEYFLL